MSEPATELPADPVDHLTAKPILVGGRPRAGRGESMVSVDPSNGRPLARIGAASPQDVGEAVAAGAEAMAAPAWRDMLPMHRARLLYGAGELIECQLEELARLQSADNGKPISETRALVASAAGTFRYYAAALETLDDDLTVPRGPYVSMSIHEPIGPVAAITPWNSPIASDAQKAAPILAAGNALLLKPAEWAPLLALRLGQILLEAGFPPGLISVLPGPGPVTGEALVTHPGVRKVTFTGGTDTGRRIADLAATKLMPVNLELGGKSPSIVLDDADLDAAVAGISFGIFSSEGQSCIAGSRLLTPKSLHDELVERIASHAEGLVIGDPQSDKTHMGPLVTAAHRSKVEAMVGRAVEAGAEIVTGASRPPQPGLRNGYYFQPTVLAGVDHSWEVCQKEIFGPVLVVVPYEDEEDLVRLANGTEYGLACGIWTRDYRRAWRLARRIDAGTVWINTYKQFSISTPFGGDKASGLGREKGRQGIHVYQTQKSLYWGLDHEPISWAFPS